VLFRSKTYNKKLPPYDRHYTYPENSTDAEKIEIVALNLRVMLNKSIEEFHIHRVPDYYIDVLWYWQNPNAIIDFIIKCGWHPKAEKVVEFCKRVINFNEMYYNITKNSFDTYNQVIKQIDAPCNLTFYETAVVHSLLMNHYYGAESDVSNVKLIHKIPTSTAEFETFY